jgi:hypothetical protein
MIKSGFVWIGPIALASLSAVVYGRQAGQDLRIPQPILHESTIPTRSLKSSRSFSLNSII